MPAALPTPASDTPKASAKAEEQTDAEAEQRPSASAGPAAQPTPASVAPEASAKEETNAEAGAKTEATRTCRDESVPSVPSMPTHTTHTAEATAEEHDNGTSRQQTNNQQRMHTSEAGPHLVDSHGTSTVAGQPTSALASASQTTPDSAELDMHSTSLQDLVKYLQTHKGDLNTNLDKAFQLISEETFELLMSEAKGHPRLGAQDAYVRSEFHVEDDWVFGCEEGDPEEDLKLFVKWLANGLDSDADAANARQEVDKGQMA